MEGNWKIIYYETPQGNSPVFDFIQNLDAKAKSKVIGVLDLLKKLGIQIRSPHAKKLTGTNLWELRILWSLACNLRGCNLVLET